MKKYEVIKKHALNYEVGQIVELSDAQALALVNKVKLVEPEPEKPKATAQNKKQASVK